MTERAPSLRLTTFSTEWLSAIVAGLVIGFIEVIIALSLASLIFTGELQPALPRGIGVMLITGAVHMVLTAGFSSVSSTVSSTQDHPATLLAVAIAALVAQMPTGPTTVSTVFVLILVTTLLAGVFVTLLGAFRLGRLVRYIPYPVIGGFIAGAGWLLAQGSIGAMAAYPLSFATLPDLLNPDQLLLWGPGVIFALVLFFGLRLIKHTLTLPTLLIGGLVVFFAALWFTGTSIESATARGMLLGSSGEHVLWVPLPLDDVARADWTVILGQIGNIGAILVITAISLLLNVSGLELLLRRDIDLNRELQMTGIANLFASVLGGTIGYPALSLTALNQRMGAGSRLTSIVSGGLCLLVLIGGAAVLAYVPKFILGGLLLFLGLDFLDEWLVQGFRKLGRLDYLVVVTIVIVIAAAGFLVGVALGLILMVGLFVVQSSQSKIFRSTLHGDEMISHVLRNAREQQLLTDRTCGIYLLELQGFIFFGTATHVLDKVQRRIHAPDLQPLQYLILDFRHVISLDSSAAYSLKKVKYLADTHHFELIFAHLTPSGARVLARSEITAGDRVHLFEDMYHALEWCETRLLQATYAEKPFVPQTLALQLLEVGFKESDTLRLQHYLDRIELTQGDMLIREGESATDLYFIERGQLSAYVARKDGRQLRIQTLTQGAIVGELAFFLETPRSATVIADVATTVYRLPRTTLERVTVDDPALALAVNRLIGRLLSVRLAAANRERAALNR